MTEDHRDAPESRERPDGAGRLAELERRLTELEAAVQALRGYVGGRRAEVASVGRRADAALAAVDRLERERRETDDGQPQHDESAERRPEATSEGER